MHRIRLSNTEFEGRNNAYVLGVDTGGPITLIDTGIAVDSVRSDLTAGLDEIGLEFGDIERILLTHWHSDHAGLAGDIQAESGASVYVHTGDAGLVDASDREWFFGRRRQLFVQWGIPESARRDLLAFLDRHDTRRGRPPTVTPFSAGRSFPLGELELETLHVPGHSAGLTAFVRHGDGESVAFVGDAILPKYTPNVGGADPRVRAPVETYVDSLRRIKRLDLDRLWPGHRDPIDDPADRASKIIEHHRERTDRVLEAVEKHGPATPWEVSAALFGELEGIHVMHGPGEAYAHLDHLVRVGAIEQLDTRYRLNPDFAGEPTDILSASG